MKPNVNLLETTRHFDDDQSVYRNWRIAFTEAVWAIHLGYTGKAVVLGAVLLILPGIAARAATTNLANYTQRTPKSLRL